MHDILGVEAIALYICYEVTLNIFYQWSYAEMQIRQSNVNIYSQVTALKPDAQSW